jgi:hypothetical protein
MIVYLAAAILLQPDAAPAGAVDAGEIIVTAERLRRIRIESKRNRKTGATTCRVKRTSGDPALDGIFCRALLTCATTARKPAEMEACMEAKIAGFIGSSSRRSVPAD